MGTLIEELDDHEGYVLWRLTDGTLTSAWTNDNRRQATAHVADCECGWRSNREHPPTEQGDEAAREEWVREHAVPELARQAARRREQLASMLGWLAQQRDRLQDPDHLRRVSEGLAWASELAERLQRGLTRSGSQREADRER
jgi:hypothetical protein